MANLLVFVSLCVAVAVVHVSAAPQIPQLPGMGGGQSDKLMGAASGILDKLKSKGGSLPTGALKGLPRSRRDEGSHDHSEEHEEHSTRSSGGSHGHSKHGGQSGHDDHSKHHQEGH